MTGIVEDPKERGIMPKIRERIAREKPSRVRNYSPYRSYDPLSEPQLSLIN